MIKLFFHQNTRKGILLLLWLLSAFQVAAQIPANTQTIKGKITDAASSFPIPGAVVVLVENNSINTVSDANGYFRLKNVPVGRQAIRVQIIGYQPRTISNILLTSGKEIELDINLVESLSETGTVEIIGGDKKKGLAATQAINELAFISARGFNLEETGRYAGSRNDPARMASNFAGVQINNDGRNDIIIRGNSPTGMLWRLDGLDIPNPSHFGAVGATGGPVSILNNNTLAKSDFFTAAFPAEYGNAVSGVFDLNMRRGNRDKREYTGQIGFNGFELGAEGPFKKGSRNSYMVNYRYSTLDAVSRFGLNVGTGAAVPRYQDLSFKTSFGAGESGKIEVFGIGGFSDINFRANAEDSTENLYSNNRDNLKYNTRMGVIGASWLHFYSQKLYGKVVLGASASTVGTKADSLDPSYTNAIKRYRDNTSNNRYSARYILNYKLDARTSFQGGLYIDRLGFNFNDSTLRGTTTPNGDRVRIFAPIKVIEGSTFLTQSFVQGAYRFNEKLQATFGLHSQTLNLNNQTVLEPRAGVKYEIREGTMLTAGYGYHAQMQPLAAYFFRSVGDNGILLPETNRNLKFTRSHHTVVGVSQNLSASTRLGVEGYYQYLTDVPVNTNPSSYSMLNFGADFNYPEEDSLVNTGLGRNYGIDVTLERNFEGGYYFLLTNSFYESKYRGSDGVWRNTAFNSRLVSNVLAGKEWKLNDKITLAFDTKITYAGGRYYTPFNSQASIAAGTGIRDESRAFDERFPDYFRVDLKVTIRLDGKRVSQEFFVDAQNITNRDNAFQRVWSNSRQNEGTINQLGFFPNVNYRILF